MKRGGGYLLTYFWGLRYFQGGVEKFLGWVENFSGGGLRNFRGGGVENFFGGLCG